VDGLGDPVDAGIAADSLVLGVDEDNLVVLVGGVLVDPVGVQDTQVGAAAADTLLSGGTESALVLELVDTHVGRLTYRAISFCHHSRYLIRKHTVGGTLGHRPLTATTADTGTVDNIALLGLVAQTTSLVGARRTGSPVDSVQLTELY